MGNFSIRTEGLKKSFGRTQALADVSFDFSAGLLHGLIGSDGAGKTTTMRLLAGLLKPSAGGIHYFSGGKPAAFSELRPSLAYMPQQASLYPDLSIDEHLEFFRELYRLDPEVYARRSAELLEITRLAKFRDRRAGQLSGGMYKKLGLMCALLQSPSVLLLDEPTNGVDPISRREFWELLYSLAADKILIIVSTAYMDEAERCSRVHLLDSGRLLASGEPRAMLKETGAANFEEIFIKKGAHK
ncbi:MAG: ABC transporter ATP-binding protein [Elusimicrobia bacterium RIFCSPHIGHO2_02_FULL_61_10]|nr:MAG: ABC transporter ATP-binding protein [Elusimicrobia bacterium RIFCSPLOWO2_02_FULL_61_11]OGS04653.1 MAG: ABC transporter ATP-binding protein [Elusimicrobia bacterium RIFCSPHIGHO2_02_FULL_61_10]